MHPSVRSPVPRRDDERCCRRPQLRVNGLLDGIALPTKRDEAWRYAPHRQLGELTFGPTVAAVDLPPDLDEQMPSLDGPRDRGGQRRRRPGAVRSRPPAGLRLWSLADAAASHPDVVHRHHGAAELVDAFTAYNLAYGTDGASS